VFSGLSAGIGNEYYSARVDVAADGMVTVIAPPSAGQMWITFTGVSFLAR
jgi:hypothetical protein